MPRGNIEYKISAEGLFVDESGVPEMGKIFDVDSIEKVRDPHFSENALKNVRIVTGIIKNLPNKERNGIYIHAKNHYKSCDECRTRIDRALKTGEYKEPQSGELPFENEQD